MVRAFLLIGLGVAFIAWGAAAFRDLSSSSSRADLVEHIAGPALDKLEELTDRVSTPAGEPLTMRIAATGVAIRSDCADDARAGGALAEGTLVAARGEAACFGWTLVELPIADGSATQQTWVRDAYLELAPRGSAGPPERVARAARPARRLSASGRGRPARASRRTTSRPRGGPPCASRACWRRARAGAPPPAGPCGASAA